MENLTLIDAIRFATAFTAFWSAATPTCEHFVRKLNLNLYNREDAPMPDAGTANRTLISEFGFCLFVERRWPTASRRSREETEVAAQEAARRRIVSLEGPDAFSEHISPQQMSEVQVIARRLDAFFSGQVKTYPRPLFPGCGFIDQSEGDVLFCETLYEVKTVDRSYRSNDIRQLITYCALNALGKRHEIEKIGLFNPRRGTSFEADVDYVSVEISGKRSSELFEDIHQAISGGGISR